MPEDQLRLWGNMALPLGARLLPAPVTASHGPPCGHTHLLIEQDEPQERPGY